MRQLLLQLLDPRGPQGPDEQARGVRVHEQLAATGISSDDPQQALGQQLVGCDNALAEQELELALRDRAVAVAGRRRALHHDSEVVPSAYQQRPLCLKRVAARAIGRTGGILAQVLHVIDSRHRFPELFANSHATGRRRRQPALAGFAFMATSSAARRPPPTPTLPYTPGGCANQALDAADEGLRAKHELCALAH